MQEQNKFWDHIKDIWDYKIDRKWVEINHTNIPKKAIVLVTNLKTLLNRVKKRVIVEEKKLVSGKPTAYPSKLWLDIYSKVDLVDIYKLWCKELHAQNIEYVLINSTDNSYSLIDSIESLPTIIHSNIHSKYF